MENGFSELIETLEKGKAFPVGTKRTWAGQEYVKHSDGWVAVSGPHHGKLMGKFKEEATHKEAADGPKPEVVEEPKEEPKSKSPKESKTKKETSAPEAKPTEAPKPQNSKTQSIDRLTVKYRSKTKIDGLPSTVPYQSPEGSTCNMVGFVAFGKASKKAQELLNNKLQQAEILLSTLNVRFKTPLDFVCQKMATGRSVQASFIPMKADNNRVNMVAADSGITKSMMHEIGHALDNAMSQNKKFRSEEADVSTQLGKAYEMLMSTVRSSDYYTSSDGQYKRYLNEPTEVFARAFEVYCFVKGQKLQAEGKLDKSFTDNYLPDVFKTKNTKLSELDSQLKALTAEYMTIRANDPSRSAEYRTKAMAELGLTTEDMGKLHLLGHEAWSNKMDEIIDIEKRLAKEDPSYLKDADRRAEITIEMGAVRKARDTMDKWISIDETKQKEFSDAIEGYMDQILKEDEVRKALSELTLDLQKAVKEAKPDFYSAVVVIDYTGKVLLGKRTEDGIWTTPAGGGHLPESPADCAIRELFEEAGLVARPEDLKPVHVADTANNKKCFVYLFEIGPGLTTTSKLDPDQEVKKWGWYAMEDIPAGLIQDERRHTSVRMAYMKHYGIMKGGKGSGIVGHKTFHEGERNRHYEEGLKIQELLNKMETKIKDRKKLDPKYKVPEAAKEVMDELKNRRDEHSTQFKIHNDKHTQAMQKEVDSEARAKIKKSDLAVDAQGSAIETGNFSQDSSNAGDRWTETFTACLAGLDYGDMPRTVQLDRGYYISVVKTDDGIYSGIVRQTIDPGQGDALEANVFKLEKQTVPTIIQALKAKEYILPEVITSQEVGVGYATAMDTVGDELEAMENTFFEPRPEPIDVALVNVESSEMATLRRKLEAVKLILDI